MNHGGMEHHQLDNGATRDVVRLSVLLAHHLASLVSCSCKCKQSGPDVTDVKIFTSSAKMHLCMAMYLLYQIIDKE